MLGLAQLWVSGRVCRGGVTPPCTGAGATSPVSQLEISRLPWGHWDRDRGATRSQTWSAGRMGIWAKGMSTGWVM